jgi:hypothetical protein
MIDEASGHRLSHLKTHPGSLSGCIRLSFRLPMTESYDTDDDDTSYDAPLDAFDSILNRDNEPSPSLHLFQVHDTCMPQGNICGRALSRSVAQRPSVQVIDLSDLSSYGIQQNQQAASPDS